MKKRAIQGFLAVTAMAWLGQPLPADIRTAAAQQPQHQERKADDQRTPTLSREGAGFSTGDRALLSGFLKEHRALQADTASPPLAGARLSFDQLRQGRTLPPALATQLSNHPEVRDIMLAGYVVRVDRRDRRVVDVV